MGKASSKVKPRIKSSIDIISARQDKLESDLFLQQYDFKPREYIKFEPDLADKVIEAVPKGFWKTVYFIRQEKTIPFLFCLFVFSLLSTLIFDGESLYFLFFWLLFSFLTLLVVKTEFILGELAELLFSEDEKPAPKNS